MISLAETFEDLYHKGDKPKTYDGLSKTIFELKQENEKLVTEILTLRKESQVLYGIIKQSFFDSKIPFPGDVKKFLDKMTEEENKQKIELQESKIEIEKLRQQLQRERSSNECVCGCEC